LREAPRSQPWAAVLDAEADHGLYKTEQEWDKAQRDALSAEHVAFYDMLDTTPTTIAGIVAVLEVLATDPTTRGATVLPHGPTTAAKMSAPLIS
jgi:hypothetical protein